MNIKVSKEDYELFKEIEKRFCPEDAQTIIIEILLGASVDGAIQSLFIEEVSK